AGDEMRSELECKRELLRSVVGISRIEVQILCLSIINRVRHTLRTGTVGRRGDDWIAGLSYVWRQRAAQEFHFAHLHTTSVVSRDRKRRPSVVAVRPEIIEEECLRLETRRIDVVGWIRVGEESSPWRDIGNASDKLPGMRRVVEPTDLSVIRAFQNDGPGIPFR